MSEQGPEQGRDTGAPSAEAPARAQRDQAQGTEAQERLRRDVSRQAERMRRARERGRPSVWFSLGMMGMIGWSVALPTLLGAVLGAWIDHLWPSSRLSWTLALLLAGVVLGCANAWRWVQQEGRHRD